MRGGACLGPRRPAAPSLRVGQAPYLSARFLLTEPAKGGFSQLSKNSHKELESGKKKYPVPGFSSPLYSLPRLLGDLELSNCEAPFTAAPVRRSEGHHAHPTFCSFAGPQRWP